MMLHNSEKRYLGQRNWREVITAILLMGVGILLFIISIVGGEFASGAYGKLGNYALGVLLGVVILALIIISHKFEFAVVVAFAIHLYVDFYLALYFVAVVMGLVLLVFFYLMRSSRYPWTLPRVIWLWILFLVLAIFPSIRGAFYNGTDYYSLSTYYPNVIFGAFIFYWLGSVATPNGASLRVLLKLLSLVAVFVAIHTIIQELTGITLFSTSAHVIFLNGVSDYQLGGPGSDVYRAGSFFTDPNWNGTFLAMMLFIPFGLFAESQNIPEKLLYLAGVLIILSALLFTYSIGAWIGAAAGFIAFLVFVGQARYRLLLPLFVIIALVGLQVFFPTQISALLQHANNPQETILRSGVWETAYRVILAYPLTGIGFSYNLYGQISDAYRVPQQYIIEDHPHNSYLELAAMGGIPILAIFLVLVITALWFVLRNWAYADTSLRFLIAGGFAAITALCVNSWSINAWTLPPIAGIGWLVLGMIASPLLTHNLRSLKR